MGQKFVITYTEFFTNYEIIWQASIPEKALKEFWSSFHYVDKKNIKNVKIYSIHEIEDIDTSDSAIYRTK